MADYKIVLPIYGVVSTKEPGKSLTLNWYRNAHYQSNNTAKRRFKRMIAEQVLQIDAITGPVRLDYHYYAKRKGTDLDNFISTAKKYFQDSLVELGVIADDNCSVIVENREKFMGVDKNNPRIEVFIKQLEDY
jgi:Holliday junction resolvase RusA-like endonuclease